MFYKLISLITKPFGGYVLLCIYICLHDMSGISISFMVILRSTTGPYGRSIIEVAYGEMLLSLYRGCEGDDSSERVVGVST